MGTFTLQYFLRHTFWEKKELWIGSLGVFYFARCWENAGMHKASMMKGQSKMFKSRHEALPYTTDAWKH